MSATPSNYEQLMVELINRARADPVGEVDRLILNDDPVQAAEPDITSALNFFNVDIDLFRSQLAGTAPVAPLAWNEALGQSATVHSELMVQYDEQSHNLPGEPGLGQRVINAGYDFNAIAENIFAFSRSALYGHAGFYIDWGYGPGGIQDPAGHRDSILNATYAEVGIGVLENVDDNLDVGPNVVTQHLGRRYNSDFALTGVVIDDTDNDDFYDIGEGLGGVTVTAQSGGSTFTTVSYASGGYTLVLPDGTYDVTFSGGGLQGAVTQSVTIGTSNVKLDVEQDDVADTSVITGNSGSNTLEGTSGNDTLEGLGGDDTLIGEGGADVLYGGPGEDTADYSDSPAAIVVRLNGSSGSGGDAAGDRLFGVENVIGSNFADTITGDGLGNSINGNGGADSLIGSGDQDELIGGAGGDQIRGNAGQDDIHGDGGNDRLFGDEDEDDIYGGVGNDRVFGGGDNDTIDGGAGDDELFGTLGADVIEGEAGNDLIAGNAGADILYGDGGNDTINGNEFADVLYGGDGNDMLNGGSGLDALYGGDNADVLNGGASSDQLTGGAGADTFQFTVTGGIDRVTDWQDGTDRLDFTSAGLGFGDFAVSEFGGGQGAKLVGGGFVVFLEGIATTDVGVGDFL
ncbi:MAG: CAP domain-containing protein [Pseudomonadota bacterium]